MVVYSADHQSYRSARAVTNRADEHSTHAAADEWLELGQVGFGLVWHSDTTAALLELAGSFQCGDRRTIAHAGAGGEPLPEWRETIGRLHSPIDRSGPPLEADRQHRRRTADIQVPRFRRRQLFDQRRIRGNKSTAWDEDRQQSRSAGTALLTAAGCWRPGTGASVSSGVRIGSGSHRWRRYLCLPGTASLTVRLRVSWWGRSRSARPVDQPRLADGAIDLDRTEVARSSVVAIIPSTNTDPSGPSGPQNCCLRTG